MSKQKSIKYVFQDLEFWAIVLFNVFIIITFLTDKTTANDVVVLYYIQSLLIGLQTFLRMGAAGVRMKPKSSFGKRFGTALFFAFHFGIFHLVYLIFIFVIIMDIPGYPDMKMVGGVGLFMLVNMIMSLYSDFKQDIANEMEPSAIMFQPYLRIMPMHIFIIIGFNQEDDISKAFYVFIILKTVADVLMHIAINQTWRRKRPKVVEGWI